MLGTVYLCSKLISRKKKNSLKRNFYGIMNQCKHKHATSLVYIIKNWELCILLITLELTLRFWLIVRNDLLKHYKNYKNQKITFDQNREQAPLTHETKCVIKFYIFHTKMHEPEVFMLFFIK